MKPFSIYYAPPDAGGAGILSNPAPAAAPAAAPTADPAPNPAPAAAPAAAPAQSWYDKLSPETKAYVDNKGWKADTDTSAVVESYQNLEKLLGADRAGRTVVLPKDAADAEALNNIYDKLGRPKDATGYAIELPEGADTVFADNAKQVFHKAGLSVDQAKTVTDWYRAAELDAAKVWNDTANAEIEGLKKEWGGDYDTKVEVAKRALTAAGMSAEEVKNAELSMGPAKFTKFMEFFGRNYVEGSAPDNVNRAQGSFATLNPEQASVKISQLYADQAFMARYNSPDPKVRAEAMTEMDNLSKLAVNAKRV